MGSSKKVDFAEGLLVFRALMGIRTNGNLRQFSLLSEVEMGSHLLANVLYNNMDKNTKIRFILTHESISRPKPPTFVIILHFQEM